MTKLIRRKYFTNRVAYWEMIESHRTPTGLATWAFDFVSIHPTWQTLGEYTLMSPLLLVILDGRAGSRRPRFEQKTFASMADARSYAFRLQAKLKSRLGIQIHIVNCC